MMYNELVAFYAEIIPCMMTQIGLAIPGLAPK